MTSFANTKTVRLRMTFFYAFQYWLRNFFGRTTETYPFMQIAGKNFIFHYCWRGTHDVAWSWGLDANGAKALIADLEHFIALQKAFDRSPGPTVSPEAWAPV